MKIYEVKTYKEKKDYIDFIYNLYKNDENYRDLNMIFLKNFLYQKDHYACRSTVIPLIIRERGIKAVGVLVMTDDSEIAKLSFLEFVPHSEDCLVALFKYCKKLAIDNHKSKIVIGINGHISYGLGVLTGSGNSFEFNGNYNLSYYATTLDKMDLVIKKAFSYKYSLDPDLFDPLLLEHINKKYSYRTMDKANFRNEMLLFGDLCDKSMMATPYYSTKTKEEMYELMKQMKPLLKNTDIIFALHNGKEVGFVFTHPDYAEFMDSARVNQLKVFVFNKIKKSTKLIINILCVLPAYRNTGVVFGLLHESAKHGYGYQQIVSSFVLEDNIPSTKVCRMKSQGIAREYHLYEL